MARMGPPRTPSLIVSCRAGTGEQGGAEELAHAGTAGLAGAADSRLVGVAGAGRRPGGAAPALEQRAGFRLAEPPAAALLSHLDLGQDHGEGVGKQDCCRWGGGGGGPRGKLAPSMSPCPEIAGSYFLAGQHKCCPLLAARKMLAVSSCQEAVAMRHPNGPELRPAAHLPLR